MERDKVGRTIRDECRQRASKMWSNASDADDAHHCLRAKQVTAHGIRQDGDRLHGLQFIGTDGVKRFLTGTAKRACFHFMGKPGDALVIAEGYATAASIHEATGHAVAVAFDAGNLRPAALAVIPPTVGDCNDVAVVSGAETVRAAFSRSGELGVAPAGATGREPEEQPEEPIELADGRNRPNPEAQIDVVAVSTRLAALAPIEYDRCRTAEAKQLGIRTSTLDTEVKRLRGEAEPEHGGGAVLLDDPEPWPAPATGAELLNELVAATRRYLVVPPSAAEVIALWIVHAHAHDTASISPILGVTSPTPECGKTTLLTFLGAVVLRPLPASNITTAALFRGVEKCRPSLLIDENVEPLRSDRLGHGR